MKKSVNKLKQFLSVSKQKRMQIALGLGMLMLSSGEVLAKSKGSGSFKDAADEISGYVENLILLIQAVGGVVGLIGALRIYNKWSNGDQDVNKEIMGWGGACIFLILAPSFLKAIFT